MFSENKVTSKSFWISVLIFSMLCFGYYIHVLDKTDFHYIYFLDDAYIHLAMAKNFALHNVWGVTSYEFSSSSSSPLFTYLLSLTIEFFGNNDQFPLYMNIVFCIGVFYFLNRYYSEFFHNTRNIVFAILFTVFFTVLHLQMMSGMEHSLHVLLIVINILCLLKINKSRSAVYGFFVTTALMGLVRFESMFYFVSLAFCFILIKKWKTALMVIWVGFVPIMIFCWFNFQESGYFFPNSVIVKGTRLDFDSDLMIQIKDIVLNNLLLNISFYKVGIFPLAMCAILIYKDLKKQKPTEVIKNNFLLIVFSILMICHALFADLKSGFRYEAYILVGFSMALIPKLNSVFENFRGFMKDQKLISSLVLANFALMIYKLWIAHLVLDNGGKNIYEQQVQSAKFLNTYYNESKIVANDIGAITYYTDIHLFDIVGLGSAEMIPFTKDKKRFDRRFEDFVGNFIANHHYELAVVYEDWFDGHVPKTWKKVAVLKISNKITVYGEEVSIYCINLNNCNQLKNNVKNFKWNKNVKLQIID